MSERVALASQGFQRLGLLSMRAIAGGDDLKTANVLSTPCR
jgi:hypothetical protein